jgi:group I intron endonuclease
MTMDVYLITCSANGKQYVGSTVNGWEERWRGHKSCMKNGRSNPAMQNSFNAYGMDAFSCRLLETVDEGLERLVEREQYWIEELNTMAPVGFNCRDAGNQGSLTDAAKSRVSESLKQYYTENSMSDETKQKISDALSGRQRPEEVRRKISEAHQGRTVSEETKARISDGVKQYYAENDVSEETRQKISETLTGIKRAPFSDEHRQKLSAAKKGRKMSEEQKRKIAEGVRKARARKRAENAAKASSEEPALEGKK